MTTEKETFTKDYFKLTLESIDRVEKARFEQEQLTNLRLKSAYIHGRATGHLQAAFVAIVLFTLFACFTWH